MLRLYTESKWQSLRCWFCGGFRAIWMLPNAVWKSSQELEIYGGNLLKRQVLDHSFVLHAGMEGMLNPVWNFAPVWSELKFGRLKVLRRYLRIVSYNFLSLSHTRARAHTREQTIAPMTKKSQHARTKNSLLWAIRLILLWILCSSVDLDFASYQRSQQSSFRGVFCPMCLFALRVEVACGFGFGCWQMISFGLRSGRPWKVD